MLLLLVAITSNCGIDSLQNFLNNKPTVSSRNEKSVVFFAGNPSVPFESNYLGIEFYYKLYNNPTLAEQDRIAFEQQQSTEIVPGTSISYLSTSSGLNYSKLNRGNTDFILNASNSFSNDSIMSFIWNYENLIFAIQDEAPIILTRTQLVGGSSFSETPKTGDIDYTAGTLNTGIVLQLYAVSNGFNFTTFNAIYSKAEYLATIHLSAY